MTLRLGRWQDVLTDVECDAVITDPPYSDRTHDGHGTMERHGTGLPPTYDDAERRAIGYGAWSADDVREFVASWSPRTRGWIVVLTDHVLAPVWEAAYLEAGRTAFAPLPWYAPGSRVRLAGDGPSNWTCWIMVARPKSLSKWGTLPGGYVTTARAKFIGGKPVALLRSLVCDYSRPGNLICDPCTGMGSTWLAARAEGRRFIGAEIDPVTHAACVERASAGPLFGQQGML